MKLLFVLFAILIAAVNANYETGHHLVQPVHHKVHSYGVHAPKGNE